MKDQVNKWTPGPWRYHVTNGSPTHGIHMIAGAKPGYLAEVRDCGSGDVRANARLIASAPDLLDALDDALELICVLTPLEGDVVRKGRAVLAKARGEA